MTVDELVAVLRPQLAGALIATDFDGTLAPLVPDPEDSRPVAGAVDALAALAAAAPRSPWSPAGPPTPCCASAAWPRCPD